MSLSQKSDGTINGDVAQLARASGSYPAGREFESPRRYHIDNKVRILGLFLEEF